MNSSLNLFTQSDILHQIGVGPLRRFVGHFISSDARLASVDLDSQYLCSELARLFTQPQSFSPRLCETLVLLETAASHENYDRLAAIAQQRLPDLCVTEFHPLALALELWLTCPDDLQQFAGSAARAASSENLPPHEPPNEHAAPTELGEGPRDVGSYRHGAPTELFQSVQIPNARCQNVEALSPPIQESTNPSIQSSAPSAPSAPIQQSTNPPIHPLNSLRSLLTRYVILPEHAAEALALWVVHTYAFELRDVTTYLGLESPVRRCGKSTLLTVLSRLVNRPLVAANVSPSALYRAIEELRPTLMIDEADTFLKPNDELIGILNAGYHRATAYVIRVQNSKPEARNSKRSTQSRSIPSSCNPCNSFNPPNSSASSPSSFNSFNPLNQFNSCNPGNPSNSITSFSCWCPKIIARIGRLPETLADRCILIRMQRKTPNDQCERLRDLDVVAVRKDLRQECAQFVQDHRDAIMSAKPEIPAALNDRAADIWEPLLALADCAGGDWPALAREAALALSSDPLDIDGPDRLGPLAPSDGERAGERGSKNSPDRVGRSLLLDIFILFAASGQDRIPTRAVVEALNSQFTDRPWMDTRKGQRSTEMWLSEQLRPFGICPRTFRTQDSLAKGYMREDFDEAFRRYIPASELDALRTLAENRLSEKDKAIDSIN